MENKEWFADWFNSHYYHILYSNRNEVEATYFIQRIIDFLQINANDKVLDIACGKGRHSIALNNLGLNVIGFDLAAESVQYAKQFENDRLQFFVHDMRKPFYINYFSLALNLFTSFGYFSTKRENDNALRAICNSIIPNGYLVIDFLNVQHEIDLLKEQETKQIGEHIFEITKWHTTTHFFKKISLLQSNSKHQLSVEKVAKLNVAYFEAELKKMNMQIQQTFGNYDLTSYNEYNSKRLIIIAKKNS